MAGHNKWTQIKRQKGAADAQKSKFFSRLAKTIALAARKGDNPGTNPDLRAAIDKAKAENMPAGNIERAIKKAGGKTDGSASRRMESVRYEAYGAGGSAIIIDAITDNKNRTVAKIKHLLSEHGAKLAEQGSVLWAFDATVQKATPKITVELSPADKELLGKLVEALTNLDDVQEIYTNAK